MKSMMKKAIALVMFAALSVTLAGCGGNEAALPVSEMAYAEASGIMGGIRNTDETSAAEFMDMEDEDVEDFFKQYGYSIDGAAFKNGLDGWLSLSEEFGGVEAISDPEMSSDSDSITATFYITGEKEIKVVSKSDASFDVSWTTDTDSDNTGLVMYTHPSNQNNKRRARRFKYLKSFVVRDRKLCSIGFSSNRRSVRRASSESANSGSARTLLIPSV